MYSILTLVVTADFIGAVKTVFERITDPALWKATSFIFTAPELAIRACVIGTVQLIASVLAVGFEVAA